MWRREKHILKRDQTNKCGGIQFYECAKIKPVYDCSHIWRITEKTRSRTLVTNWVDKSVSREPLFQWIQK